MDTYDSDFSAKVIMMTWQANIARRSAGLGMLLSNEDRDIATSFYNETIKCLQTVTKHHEIIEILEDFSKEILTDLELKDYTFKSKELIINCIQIIQNLITLPAILKYEKGKQTEILPIHGNHEKLENERKKALQSTLNSKKNQNYSNDFNDNLSTTSFYSDSYNSINSNSSNIEKEYMSVEQEQKLKIIAVDRMKIIFCIFKVFIYYIYSIYYIINFIDFFL